MDLGLTKEQQMLKDTARRFFDKECPKTTVRELLDSRTSHSEALWQQMVEMGWLGLPFPEIYGGYAAGFLELGVIVEEMGRALLPGPFFSTVLLGGYPLLEAGTDQQKEEMLARLIEGELILTLAWLGTGPVYDPNDAGVTARRDGEGFVLDGTRLFVPNAEIADVILTVARVPETDGPTIFLVDRGSEGIETTALPMVDGSKVYEVSYRSVRLPAARVLGALGGAGAVLERTLARAAIAECLQLVGGAQMALEMSVEHVKNRVQFGQPVGAFQAVQHHCANMATDLDGARFLSYQAACKMAGGQAATKEAAMAKAWVSDACHRIISRAHQVHGGVGFIAEHDLTLYFKRTEVGEGAYGGSHFHYRALSRALGL